MVHITVPDEVAQAIAEAGSSALLVDSNGRTVGQVLRTSKQLDPEVELAFERMEDAKRGGRFFTTKEVMEHLKSPE